MNYRKIEPRIDISAYAKSFMDNVVFSSNNHIERLGLGYIGYKTGVLVVPRKMNEIIGAAYRETIGNPFSYSIPKSITEKFQTIIFEEGCTSIKFQITERNETVILPDSFSQLSRITITDGGSLRKLRMPFKVDSISSKQWHLSSSDVEKPVFPNLKIVNLPRVFKCWTNNFFKQVVGPFDDDEEVVADGILLRALNADDDGIFYVTDRVDALNLTDISSEVETIICSPETKYVNVDVCENVDRVEIYLHRGIKFFGCRNVRCCRVFYDGYSSELNSVDMSLDPVYSFSESGVEIITLDGHYINQTPIEENEEVLDALASLRKLYEDHYRIKTELEHSGSGTSVHLNNVCYDHADALKEAEELHIEYDGSSSSASLLFDIWKNPVPKIKRIYVDKRIKTLRIAENFPNRGVFCRDISIFFNRPSGDFSALARQSNNLISNATLHFTDRTIKPEDGKVYTMSGATSDARPESKLRLQGLKLDNSSERNVVCTMVEELWANDYCKFKFFDTPCSFFTSVHKGYVPMHEDIYHSALVCTTIYERYSRVGRFEDVISDCEETGIPHLNNNLFPIIEDYNKLVNANPFFIKTEDDVLIETLNDMKCFISRRFYSADHEKTNCVLHFLTFKNPESLSLALLTSIYKHVYGYTSLQMAFNDLMDMSFIWEDDGVKYISMFRPLPESDAIKLIG